MPDPMAPFAVEIRMLAFVLITAGYLLHLWLHRHDPGPDFSPLLRATVLTALIALNPLIVTVTQAVLYYFPHRLEEDGSSLGGWIERLARATDALQPQTSTASLLSLDFSVIANHLVYLLVYAATGLIYLVILPMQFAQRALTLVGTALLPLVYALLAVPALRGLATKYIVALLSVFAWPTGFALASAVGNFAAGVGSAGPDSGAGYVSASAMLTVLMPFVVYVAFVVATPLVCYFAFTSTTVLLPVAVEGSRGGLAVRGGR